jgi:DNA-binding NarL/FixJ family response regulator
MEKNTILVATTRKLLSEYLEIIILEDSIGDSVRIVDNGVDVLRVVEEEVPACIVMCLFLPLLSGLGILRKLREMGLNIPTLCFCDDMKVRNGVIAIKEGARGVIDLTRGRFEFGKAMRMVRENKRYIPADVQRVLEEREYEYHPEKFRDLSLREEEVLQMVARGHSNKDVAHQLNISQKTVEKHKKSIRDKLGLQSSSEICFFAVQEGLVKMKEGEECLFNATGKISRRSMEPTSV